MTADRRPQSDRVSRHLDHEWYEDGGCVHCACGVRLYRGSLPKRVEDRAVLARCLDELLEQAERVRLYRVCVSDCEP